MKKRIQALQNNYLPAFLILLFAICDVQTAHSQQLQPVPGYGFQWNRGRMTTLFGLPTDTFAVTGTLQTYPWLASKSNVLYQWNTSTLFWELAGSIGITFPYTTKKYLTGYNTFGSMNSDTLIEGATNLFYTTARALLKLNVSDTASMLANYLRGATSGFGITITGTQHKTWTGDTTSGGFLSWVRGKKIIDSLAAAGWGANTLDKIFLQESRTAVQTGTNIIDANGFDFHIDGDFGGFTNVYGASGGALKSTSSSNFGLHGISQTDVAGVVGENSSTTAASIQTLKDISNRHLATPAIDIYRTTTGVAQDGIGSKIRFITETSTGAQDSANIIESYWSNATNASRESRVRLWGVNNTAQEKFLEIQHRYILANNGADTVAYLSDVRAGGGGGAGLVDGDYGDITVSGTGTVMTIDNSAVTNAKLASKRKLGIEEVIAADANITAAAGTVYSLPAATLSTNRTIDMTNLNTNGDYIEFDNQEAGFTWTFTGQTVYDAYENAVTVLWANTRYIIRRTNGKLKIIN